MRRVILLFALGAVALVFGGCYSWRESQVTETKKRGDVVRHALNEYRTKTGSFPKSLDALVPEYVKVIPQPTVGRRAWNYKAYLDNTGYLLSVALRSEREPELHAAETGEWVYHTK